MRIVLPKSRTRFLFFRLCATLSGGDAHHDGAQNEKHQDSQPPESVEGFRNFHLDVQHHQRRQQDADQGFPGDQAGGNQETGVVDGFPVLVVPDPLE